MLRLPTVAHILTCHFIVHSADEIFPSGRRETIRRRCSWQAGLMTALLVYDIGCNTQSRPHVHSVSLLQSCFELSAHLKHDPDVAHVCVNKLI